MKVGYCPRWQGLRAEPGAARFMSAKRHAARPTDRALRAAGNHRRRRGVPPDDLGPVLYVPSRLASRFEFREHFGCPALNKLRDLVDSAFFQAWPPAMSIKGRSPFAGKYLHFFDTLFKERVGALMTTQGCYNMRYS